MRVTIELDDGMVATVSGSGWECEDDLTRGLLEAMAPLGERPSGRFPGYQPEPEVVLAALAAVEKLGGKILSEELEFRDEGDEEPPEGAVF